MNQIATRLGPRSPEPPEDLLAWHPRDVPHPRRASAGPSMLVADDGTTVRLDVERWHGDVDRTESDLLTTLADPVLDVGCGPGRIGAALSAAGRTVLGIDASPTAVRWARERGALAVCCSVFDDVPNEGRWGTALLLDGNIGIGGDPLALLGRIRELLCGGGEVVAEVAAPGSPTGPIMVRHVDEAGVATGPHFSWARVSADTFEELARRAGFTSAETWHCGGRWFGRATRR